MDHHPVKSSRIASIAYDEASGILEIRFHDDSTLRYEKVPERIYRLFLSWYIAPPNGVHFKRLLKQEVLWPE